MGISQIGSVMEENVTFLVCVALTGRQWSWLLPVNSHPSCPLVTFKEINGDYQVLSTQDDCFSTA